MHFSFNFFDRVKQFVIFWYFCSVFMRLDSPEHVSYDFHGHALNKMFYQFFVFQDQGPLIFVSHHWPRVDHFLVRWCQPPCHDRVCHYGKVIDSSKCLSSNKLLPNVFIQISFKHQASYLSLKLEGFLILVFCCFQIYLIMLVLICLDMQWLRCLFHFFVP